MLMRTWQSSAFVLNPFQTPRQRSSRRATCFVTPSRHGISSSKNRPHVTAVLFDSAVPSPPTDSDFVPIITRPSTSSSSSTPFETDADVATDFTSGGGGGSGGNPSDRFDRFSDDNDDNNQPPSDMDDQLSSLLSEKKVGISDIPQEIINAYYSNLIPIWAISNYLVARANPLSRIMLPIPSMRDRFLADKLFLLKILIEEGIGLFGKLSAEYEQRRSRFWREGEFVLANVIMAMLADFALVYFPAPSLSLVAQNASSTGFFAWLSSLSATLPSNIFQTDRHFTLAQRAGGFFFKFSQLFSVGFLCCFSGVVITNGLVFIRERVDPSYKPETSKQNPFLMSVLYALFLGASSGTRYQFLNGIENHIFPRLFARAPLIVEQVATFGLRFGNTFWGSQQWVMFARLTNLQKLKASPDDQALPLTTSESEKEALNGVENNQTS